MQISRKPLTAHFDAPSTKFEDNYKLRKFPANNKKGYKQQYVYTGDFFTWTNPPEMLKKLQLLDKILASALIVLFFAANTYRTDVNVYFPAAFPALCALVPLIFTVISCVNFIRPPMENGKITVMAWAWSYRRIQISSLTYSALMIAAVCLGIYRLSVIGFSIPGASTILFYIIGAAIGVILAKKHSELKYKSEVNKLSSEIDAEKEKAKKDYLRRHGIISDEDEEKKDNGNNTADDKPE